MCGIPYTNKRSRPSHVHRETVKTKYKSKIEKIDIVYENWNHRTIKIVNEIQIDKNEYRYTRLKLISKYFI